MICIRCGQPRPKEAFSSVEVKKRRSASKICQSCSETNPYFERRYALALMFSRLLPQEVLQRISVLSEPGDEFTVVHRQSFECQLCRESWSLLTHDMERHVHQPVHCRRV